MANLRKAESRMDKVIMDWYITDRLLLHVWCLVEKKPSKDQETMGIDTSHTPPILKYNPNFVNKLTYEQLETVMVSEAHKLLLKHPTTRLQKPENIASLSSTITVTGMLNKLPGTNLDLSDSVDYEAFGLEGDSYFEDYFRKLLDKSMETNSKIEEIWSSKSSDDNQEGEAGSTDGDGYPNVSDKPMKEYSDPNGTSNKDWGQNEVMEAEVKNLVDKHKGSSKMWGKYTSKHQGSIVSANTPKISCREFLRRFNNSVLSGKSISSRMKVNRRYDLEQPGNRRVYKSNIIVAIDQSGSITNEELSEGMAIVNATCKHAKITYVLFDTKINTIEKDIRLAKKRFDRTACGGTDYNDVCKYAENEKVDGLVILTDGYAFAPKKPRGVKVFWLLLKSDQQPPVKWGYKGYLENK